MTNGRKIILMFGIVFGIIGGSIGLLLVNEVLQSDTLLSIYRIVELPLFPIVMIFNLSNFSFNILSYFYWLILGIIFGYTFIKIKKLF